jgi:hypothetical protein
MHRCGKRASSRASFSAADLLSPSPPAAAEDPEDCALLGDPQVAPQSELEPTRDSVAGDRRD